MLCATKTAVSTSSASRPKRSGKRSRHSAPVGALTAAEMLIPEAQISSRRAGRGLWPGIRIYAVPRRARRLRCLRSERKEIGPSTGGRDAESKSCMDADLRLVRNLYLVVLDDLVVWRLRDSDVLLYAQHGTCERADVSAAFCGSITTFCALLITTGDTWTRPGLVRSRDCDRHLNGPYSHRECSLLHTEFGNIARVAQSAMTHDAGQRAAPFDEAAPFGRLLEPLYR